MKKALLLLSVFAIGFILFTGQKYQDNSPKWNVDPAMTRLTPVGQYDNLPSYPNSNNYVNPNAKTTYYYTPQGVMAVSPNFRLYPDNAPCSQSEVNIYASQLNPNWILASANFFNGSSFFSTPGYISTNGGLNWFGKDTSVSNYGDPGPIIDKNGAFIISHITLSGSMGATWSTNFGTTWSPTVTFPGASTSADKNLSGTNYASSSPYYGHSYTVYTEFAGTYTNRIVFTKTTNSGQAWSTIQVISPTTASGHHHQGCDVTAGPEGYVYAIWANCTTNGQNSTEDSLGFARSTDGGTTWDIAKNNAADMNGIRAASFGPWGIRVAGFPRIDVDKTGGARNGWIYVVASEKNFNGGDASDVFLWKSTDKGVTWSAPIRVNQDAANGKLQYHAAVNVDASGGVNVVYHDCRNSNSNDSVDTYVNRSVDGGNTWTEIKVNDVKFRPAPISGLATGYQGDYIGITSANNKIFPNWADNRLAGRYQSWAAYIDIGPSIAHTPLGNTEQTTGNRVVNCVITPAGSGINPSTAKLYYAKGSTSFTSINLTNSGGTNWTANLPLSGAGVYNYYLIATDSASRTGTAPAGAPASYFSFTAASDTVKPVIATTPLTDVPKVNWPATVTASVTDNIGVDSVWVRWYKNNTSTGWKQFRLNFTSGSNYQAAFNSLQSEVAFNDSIFYRVLARDNSSGHNADSTTLYKFKIINQFNACVGTGTTSSNYPFTTYWMDGRTQMLYTAAELNAAGMTAGTAIMKLGFNVISASNQLMNGFNVRYQLTTQTSLTGWVTSGWTTAMTGTYSVPGTGWQYIDMTSPYFVYNGTSNLLIEVCYDNTSYTSYSTVNSTAAAGMTYGYYTDNSAGCTMTSGAVQANRPNVCFVLTATGTGNNTTIIPNKYELGQNYPNPFNPTTKINFAIPKQGLVTMKIYDVLGREVRTLVNEVKQAGNYTVDFNASEFASGVYFYKIQAGEFADIKRMILVK